MYIVYCIEQVLLFYCTSTSRRKKGPAKRAIHLIFQLVYTLYTSYDISYKNAQYRCNVVFFPLYSIIKP
jgi:hypothetical protein